MSAITSRTASSPARLSTLPQYGFSVECGFQALVEHNSFLYRVYTPRTSPQDGDLAADNYFVAKKYDHAPKHTTFAADLRECHSYDDIITHLDWMTRSSSPYISTSFSFAWSLWEAMRRYRIHMKHDVEIAVIDARQVMDRAVTVTDILRNCSPQKRHSDYWKWYQFSLESQDVFVYGAVPNSAILASIPLRSIIDNLPTYYFSPSEDADLSPFKRFIHDHAHHRATYRRFCQDISSQFSRLTPEEKLCDSTTGSVRFALTFLRPWFERVVIDDFDLATAVLSDFACTVAQWPAKHWATQHPEVFEVIDSICRVMAEEIRRKHNDLAMKELSHLQTVIGALEQDVRDYTERSTIEPPIHATAVETHETPISPPPEKRSSVAQAVCTGFLFGALMTLSMVSSQRRYISNQFR